MAVGEEDLCAYHDRRQVALFCQTCEELVCTLCVSQGGISSARHRDHVYLDIIEAYELVQEDMEKVVSKFKDSLENKKQERQVVQGRLQHTKFELLRKRSLMERRGRSISDKLKRAQKKFLQELEELVTPALAKTELKYKDLEFEVVSREGMLGSAESLGRLPSNKAITYLKHIVRTKRDMQKAVDRDCRAESAGTQLKQCLEFDSLRRASLAFHAEKKTVSKIFRMPASVPGVPRVLYSWCVVGVHQASIVWKSRKSQKIDRFLVCVHQIEVRRAPGVSRFTSGCKRRGCVKTSLNTFKSGRCQMTLRRLKPTTWYRAEIRATNMMGESQACVAVFVTRPESTNWLEHEGEVFTRAPQASLVDSWPQLGHRLLALMSVLVYCSLLVYLALWSYEQVALCGPFAHAQRQGACVCADHRSSGRNPLVASEKDGGLSTIFG